MGARHHRHHTTEMEALLGSALVDNQGDVDTASLNDKLLDLVRIFGDVLVRFIIVLVLLLAPATRVALRAIVVLVFWVSAACQALVLLVFWAFAIPFGVMAAIVVPVVLATGMVLQMADWYA